MNEENELSSLSLLRVLRSTFGRRIQEVEAIRDSGEHPALTLWSVAELIELKQAKKQLSRLIYMQELDEE